MVLYRVVADDKEMIESPEAGETLMITEGFAYRDHNPGESGLRHYSVWAYKGKDLGEIISAQPVFMGETAVIYPPVNVKVTTIKGAIQVSWDLLDGHEGAVVYACKDNERDKLSHALSRTLRPVDARLRSASRKPARPWSCLCWGRRSSAATR